MSIWCINILWPEKEWRHKDNKLTNDTLAKREAVVDANLNLDEMRPYLSPCKT